MPSMPSVSAASTNTPGWPCSASAQPSRNSVALPPRPPFCLTVTVVSPPDKSTHGFLNGAPRCATCRASAACTWPTTRDSPSISSLRMYASMPACRASAAAASRLICGVAIICSVFCAQRASPGLGVSYVPLSRPARAAVGSAI